MEETTKNKRTGRPKKPDTDRYRDGLMSLYLPPPLKTRMRVAAAYAGLSMSKFAGRVIMEKLEQLSKESA
jgi:hypothetical protein